MKTHCIHGHEYTPENTYIKSTGFRGCKKCKNNQTVAYRAKHRKPRPPSKISVERNAIIERCAIIAETLHGVDEGDIAEYVRAGHRIAAKIRRLKKS